MNNKKWKRCQRKKQVPRAGGLTNNMKVDPTTPRWNVDSESNKSRTGKDSKTKDQNVRKYNQAAMKASPLRNDDNLPWKTYHATSEGGDIFYNNNRKLENSPKTRSVRGVWTDAEFDTMEDTEDPLAGLTLLSRATDNRTKNRVNNERNVRKYNQAVMKASSPGENKFKGWRQRLEN